ncbi:cell adhesion molecule CEACAM20-like [Scyliorhinus torazame]|uniref:cell adhesion molecule CEACAM20-like n=1 Tax=Scyliorhinus torazame TaxID=75743 RepID=UPI003B5CEFAD
MEFLSDAENCEDIFHDVSCEIYFSNVTVLTNNSKPMENMDTIFLTCHASGFILSWIWYKDDRVIKDNDRVITSPDNVTLTISNVNRYDSGTYKCKASNDFSSESGDTKLQVNYGPENVNIRPPGPIHVGLGETLTLNRAALSVPAPPYEWCNESRLFKTVQTYNIESISLIHGGNYTCQVSDIITEKSRSTTKNNKEQRNLSPDHRLHSGVIAGIVIGVLILGSISGLSAWLLKRKACRVKDSTQWRDAKNIPPMIYQEIVDFYQSALEKSSEIYHNKINDIMNTIGINPSFVKVIDVPMNEFVELRRALMIVVPLIYQFELVFKYCHHIAEYLILTRSIFLPLYNHVAFHLIVQLELFVELESFVELELFEELELAVRLDLEVKLELERCCSQYFL